ncbi:MAG: cytochrome-c peroxidase [Polyangiaceae bacterium]
MAYCLIAGSVIAGSIVAGCDQKPAPSASLSASAAEQASAPASTRRFNDLARDHATQALAALEKVDPATNCKLTPAYLELRSAIFAGKAWWRIAEREASEVLLGPERPMVEGGGRLGMLDAALESGDCKDAKNHVFQIRSALRLIQLQLRTFPESRPKSARRLSFMAAELGGVILEATPEVSLFQSGMRADARGLLRGLREGAALLHTDANTLEQLNGQIAAFQSALVPEGDAALLDAPPLTGRAELVRQTGALGLEVRRLIRLADPSATSDLELPFQPSRRDAYTEQVRLGERTDVAVTVLSLPEPRTLTPKSRVELGKRLFFDKRLSKGNSRSCASCHEPGRGYSDGKPRAVSLDPAVPKLRNVPSLLYTASQAAFLWDGRLLTAKRQAQRVIHSRAEMGLTEAELVERLSGDADLKAAFTKEFKDGVTAENVGTALAAFQAAMLSPGESPLDRFARGQAPLDAQLSRGLDVFSGKARCARCHVPPLFAGTRPNDFAISVFAAIGVTTAPTSKQLDPDLGRFEVTHSKADRHVFKTPSLRDIGLTAPYFHNGAFKTLEQVIDFYDQGGALGLGLELPNQDPDVRKLELTTDEKRLLLKFLREGLADPQESIEVSP